MIYKNNLIREAASYRPVTGLKFIAVQSWQAIVMSRLETFQGLPRTRRQCIFIKTVMLSTILCQNGLNSQVLVKLKSKVK